MPGSQTTPSSVGTRNIAPADFAFRRVNNVALGIITVSRLNGWPRRSPPALRRRPNGRPRTDQGRRYSFIAVDFHHILLAGFSRRTHSRCGLHTRAEGSIEGDRQCVAAFASMGAIAPIPTADDSPPAAAVH